MLANTIDIDSDWESRIIRVVIGIVHVSLPSLAIDDLVEAVDVVMVHYTHFNLRNFTGYPYKFPVTERHIESLSECG